MSTHFKRFAAMVVARHDDRGGETLLDHGPEEQVATVVERLLHFAKTTPLIPVIGTDADIAGFGKAPLYFKSEWDEYVLLSQTSESIGWSIQKAYAWADRDYDQAVREQRHLDERRSDHLLGYECMRGVVDLGISAVIDDPEARPDASGHRWSFSGDWLVAKDRLPSLLLDSPWSKEFMDNSMDAMRHAFFGENAPEGLRPELPLDEALRKARRGPVLDGDSG